MKALGAQIQAFYTEWPLGDDWYCVGGSDADESGLLGLEPAIKYDVDEIVGELGYQGLVTDRLVTVTIGQRSITLDVWLWNSASKVFRVWLQEQKEC